MGPTAACVYELSSPSDDKSKKKKLVTLIGHAVYDASHRFKKMNVGFNL